MNEQPINSAFYNQIVQLLHSAKRKVVQAVNETMVFVYFEVGRMIVEEEQQGRDRAKYGKQLLKELSRVLTKEFGKGFSVTNIQQMRNFYLAYKNQQTLSAKSESNEKDFDLSWSHYLLLMRIDDLGERGFYEIEARCIPNCRNRYFFASLSLA